jgi:hypothetical protein
MGVAGGVRDARSSGAKALVNGVGGGVSALQWVSEMRIG